MNSQYIKIYLFILLFGLQIEILAQTDSESMPGMATDTMHNMDHEDMQGMSQDTQSNTEGEATESTSPDTTSPKATTQKAQPAAPEGSGESKSSATPQDGGKTMDHSDMPGMDHGTMEGMDHKDMPNMDHGTMQGMEHKEMQGMDHSTMQGMDHSNMPGMDHNTMQGMDHSIMSDMNMQGGAYALPGPRQLRFADEHEFSSLMVDRLEAVRTNDNKSLAYDLQAWNGGDYDRIMFKAEGDYDNNRIEEASSEILWSHAVFAYWNTELGLRYDSGEAPDRNWLAVGMQGLAPYWFEINAMAYIGSREHGAFVEMDVEYDVLLTQKVVLQPRFAMEAFTKDDVERGIGSGLSDLSIGLRLRYELLREFAPYVGVEWAGKYGKTAEYAEDAGGDSKETRTVAGVRIWF